jgi:hypothetical protein
MFTFGTAAVVVAWMLALTVGMGALGYGVFALSMWSNRAAYRLFETWDLRKAAARLVADIHRAHARYRAGFDVTAGARPELP